MVSPPFSGGEKFNHLAKNMRLATSLVQCLSFMMGKEIPWNGKIKHQFLCAQREGT